MRKTVATFFMSLDGVVEAPEQWHLPYVNDELGAALGAGLAEADTLLYGRRTYDTMAGTWPAREAAAEAAGEDPGFAKTLGDACKIVVSRSSLELTWRGSEQLQGDLLAGVKALKAGDGMRLFDDGQASVPLRLLSSETFATGVVHLVYAPAEPTGAK